MAASEMGSPVFTDDVTADRCTVLYSLLTLSQILKKLTGQCFTGQMGNDPRHTVKETQGRKAHEQAATEGGEASPGRNLRILSCPRAPNVSLLNVIKKEL